MSTFCAAEAPEENPRPLNADMQTTDGAFYNLPSPDIDGATSMCGITGPLYATSDQLVVTFDTLVIDFNHMTKYLDPESSKRCNNAEKNTRWGAGMASHAARSGARYYAERSGARYFFSAFRRSFKFLFSRFGTRLFLSCRRSLPRRAFRRSRPASSERRKARRSTNTCSLNPKA